MIRERRLRMLDTLQATATARTAPLEARVQSFAALRPQDLSVLRACDADLRATSQGAAIGGDAPLETHPRLIVSGWAGAVRHLPDGRRQILQLFLQGDVLGLSPIRLGSVVALTGVTTTDARPLAAALAARAPPHAALHLAWERSRLARQQQILGHIVRLGRLSAYERTAHLVLEMMDRHRRAGLSDGRRMPWPLTQETLADVLGLSVVHVNRILQQLRREDMIVLQGGQLIVPDVERLSAVAAWEG
jgi:CRP-like cAMP-binding protein